MASVSGNTGPAAAGDGRRGFFFAMSAYVLWGFLPLYMKAVAHISPYEVVAERIVWSLPIAAAILGFQGRLGPVLASFRAPRMLMLGFLTATLISVNWLTYVWAISAGRALETALGYYINPLVNVLLGTLILKERFTPPQASAIGLALVGVIIMTVVSGGLPWVSLVLALSFGLYAYLKKTLPIGPIEGFTLEVLMLTPLAFGYMLWLEEQGVAHFHGLGGGPWSDTLLLVASGAVTAVPLILYSLGARLLRLTTIGLMQYVAPSMIFLIAVFVFGEPFNFGKLVAFGFIWGSLALYTATMILGRK